MRDNFSEYFRPTEEETKLLWAEAIFVFDTNVLLNLYRVSASVSTKLREVLALLEGRLFLPNQVGLEFFKHAESEIAKQVNAFAMVKSELLKIPNGFGKAFSRHPCIPINDITDALRECIDEQIKRVEKSQEDNPLNFLFNDDPILNELNSLFAKSSEANYTEKENIKLDELVDNRIRANDAPCNVATNSPSVGLLDKSPHRGDGRVWFQIVKHAAAVKKPFVFVTADMQPNWWRTTKLGNDDRPVGPHFTLIRDIMQASESKFWMYTQEQFLLMAPMYLGASDQSVSISEIKLLQETESSQADRDILDEPKAVTHSQAEKSLSAGLDSGVGFTQKESYPENKSKADLPVELKKEQSSNAEEKDA